MKFIFDLDGTVTLDETLPLISRHFEVDEEMSALTERTVRGDIPFIESFIKRFQILSQLDETKVSALLADIRLNEQILQFIHKNRQDCVIATGNYRGWISRLADRIGCDVHASEGEIDQAGNLKLKQILKKEDIVRRYQEQGETVVFIGDGNNDAEAMRLADVSIACGIVHAPAKSVLQVCDYAVYDSTALCRLMKQIQRKQQGRSVVISCAGIGSRLGLGQTKSLIKLGNKPIIHYQLELFKGIEDLRIVVGFQSADLIETVLKIRKDVIFVYNHDYFHTKTGASLYLGARHANEYVIAWDGDLLVHPDDVKRCLDHDGQYVGISKLTTEDAVFVEVDEQRNIQAFSRKRGDYEWSGPACLMRDNIKYVSGHVYSQIENHLPIPSLLVRAQDIDTYADYQKAIEFVETWPAGNAKIDDYYSKLAATITAPTQTRNKAKDFSRFDIEFVKRFGGKDLTLLDLGSGTGLLINHLIDDFRNITAVEKYKKFSDFIIRTTNLQVLNEDLLHFTTDDQFDRITIFGVMNFFSTKEAKQIYNTAYRALKPGGIMIVKHQMGVKEDVVIDGYSEELGTNYYSEYRWTNNEKTLLTGAGFSIGEIVDVYPKEYNRWPNTHFYAIVCNKD